MAEGTETYLYSIGHGIRKIDEFIGLLKKYEIKWVVDVRTKPQSRFHPQYNRKALEESLRTEDLRYVFMGEELGGIPKTSGVRDEFGHIDYELLKRQDYFQHGIERLFAANKQHIRIACMCSETKPCDCHRSKLIGEVLFSQYKLSMLHITKEGDIESQEQVMKEIQPQPDLLGKGLGSKGVYNEKGRKIIARN